MSKYNAEKSHAWYMKNRDRLLPIRRAYNKKRGASAEGKEKERIRNASPERVLYRKQYKKTEAGKEAHAKYMSKDTTKSRLKRNRIKTRYGITEERYRELVAEQGGTCAICKEPSGQLHIDHDHVTGRVRGLLCGTCNRGLGMFKDDADNLRSAITYLSEHEV